MRCAPAHDTERHLGGQTGRQAVVDDDDITPPERWQRTAGPEARDAAVDGCTFSPDQLVDGCLVCPCVVRPEGIDQRLIALGHRSDGELALLRGAYLADHQHVERCIEPLGHLERDGHTTTRKGEDRRPDEAQTLDRLAELAAGADPVEKAAIQAARPEQPVSRFPFGRWRGAWSVNRAPFASADTRAEAPVPASSTQSCAIGHDAAVAKREVGQLYDTAIKVIKPMFNFSWRFHVRGIENVPAEGGAIICANHTSVLDSFFLPAVLPRRITYVGKAEYMDDWKTKYLFPALGMIPIDRAGGNASERALAAARGILEEGELFGIYPEGTRSRSGLLYRGHTGPARLALRTGAPIIPVGIRGSREVMPPDAKLPKPFRPVSLEFGRPITVDRYRDRPNDRLVLRQIIDEVMYSIRELSGQEYVDEYATKKAEQLPTDTARMPTAASITEAEQAGPVNGHRAHDQRDDEDPTTPRSSADVLRRAAAARR